MQLNLSPYPEILFTDATYKLNDMRIPLIAEDVNGESVVVVGLFRLCVRIRSIYIPDGENPQEIYNSK